MYNKLCFIISLLLPQSNSLNLIYSNFATSNLMIKKLNNIYNTPSTVLESEIKDVTSVNGWENNWLSYNNRYNCKYDHIHSLSGGIINSFLNFDANEELQTNKLILESPVYPNINSLNVFNCMMNNNDDINALDISSSWLNEYTVLSSIGKTNFIHKHFTNFDEYDFLKLKFTINEMFIDRCDEIHIFELYNDPLNIPKDIELLKTMCLLRDKKCLHHKVKAKHAMFSIFKTEEFNSLLD